MPKKNAAPQQDPDAVLVTQAIEKSVQLSGGVVTLSISQILNPIASMISGHPQAKDGICRAMTAKWLVMKGNGEDFASWIYDDVKLKKVNASAISNLACNQVSCGTKKESPEADDDSKRIPAGVRDYFRFNGYEEVDEGGNCYKFMAGKATEAIGSHIENRSASKLSMTLFAMTGNITGHGVGAICNGEDVTFFDPNFGEFSFSSRQSFSNFCAGVIRLAYKNYDYLGFVSIKKS